MYIGGEANKNKAMSFLSRAVSHGVLLAVPFLLTAAARADLFVADGDQVKRFDAQTGALLNGSFVSLSGVTGLTIGPDKNLYVGHDNEPEILRYSASTGAPIDTNPDHSAKPFVFYEGTPPTPDPHDVLNPQGMRFGPGGRLYVADVTNSNIHVYDSLGNSVTSLNDANIDQPTDLAFDSGGNLYVASGVSTILRSAGGTGPFTTFVTTQAGGLVNPGPLTFGPDGKLYVLDASAGIVYRYKADGSTDGIAVDVSKSMTPSDLAFGPDGKLYISGTDNDFSFGEIARFLLNGTPDGKLVTSDLTGPTFMAFNDVPEPAGTVILALAGLGLLGRRRSARN